MGASLQLQLPNPTAGPYLVPDLEVLTLLGTAAHLLVEALVDEAVELIRAVRAVIVVVAKQRLWDAFSVLAQEEGVVALVLCSGQRGKSSCKHEQPGSPTPPAPAPAGTWAAAAWVLGRLIRVVVAVELAIALPLAVAEAAAVGTAKLMGATGWVLCR